MTPSSWLRAMALLCWLPQVYWVWLPSMVKPPHQGVLEPSSLHQAPLSPGRDRTQLLSTWQVLGCFPYPPPPQLSAALVLYHTRRLEKSP